jgi:protein TonB
MSPQGAAQLTPEADPAPAPAEAASPVAAAGLAAAAPVAVAAVPEAPPVAAAGPQAAAPVAGAAGPAPATSVEAEAASAVEADAAPAIEAPAVGIPGASRAPASVGPAGTALFAGFLGDAGRRRPVRWMRRVTVAVSVAAHAVLVVVGVVSSFWTVDELSAPRVAVTMLTLPAPPPPPPAAKTVKAAPRPRPRPVPPVVQPVVTTQPVPPPDSDAEQADEEQAGEAEGVAGGVCGGVAGAVLSAAAPPALPQLTDAQRREAVRRYLDEVLRPRVAAHASLPPEAERLGIEGRVIMRLRIDTAGRLIALRPGAACPHEVLCEAAARAVRAAAPFPPPPSALAAGSGLEIDFPLTYRLDE